MTSPPQQIEIECPACGRIYEDWHRASIILDLEGWDAGDPEIRAYLRECSTGTCRHCGHADLHPAPTIPRGPDDTLARVGPGEPR